MWYISLERQVIGFQCRVMMVNTYLEKIRDIVLKHMENEQVDVYLFGSWARGSMRRSSDVDIAVDGKKTDISLKISALREALEESTVPYRVDVVDMGRASEVLCEEIRREGILWKKA